jgi:hypothetical protein
VSAHILIIADGRSPTALSWIKNIQTLGYRVSLISTYPCTPPPGLTHFFVLPIAFSRFSAGSAAKPKKESKNKLKALVKGLSPLLQSLRYWLGPLSLGCDKNKYLESLREIQPDIVHALRIPFEGMLGSYTPPEIPFLAATWGNDLTLHTKGSFLMRKFTRRCLYRADGISSDTQRDIRLAYKWGLHKDIPTLVVPGSGGLDLQAIENAKIFDGEGLGLPDPNTHHWMVNPRGIRPGSIHQEKFFASIPKVLNKNPDCCFICPGLAGVKQATAWMTEYHLQDNVFLLPKLEQTQLWALFKLSKVFVSPSSHDGTPNTLLEAMACGCFPVVGDIESLREWINPGQNGYLVSPRDPDQLAIAILNAIQNKDLRLQAADRNLGIIKERASQEANHPKIKAFYAKFYP